MAITQSPSRISTLGSPSLSSAYYYTTNNLSFQPVSTSTTSSYHTKDTVPETTPTVKPTGRTQQTTLNATSHNKGKQKSGADSTIISVVAILLLLAIVAAIIWIVHRRRRVSRQDKLSGDYGKRPDANAYANAAFSANGVDTDHPDVVSDISFSHGLWTQHPLSSLTNPEGSSNSQVHIQDEYRTEDPSILGQGDYTDLKKLDESKHYKRNGESEYSFLEGPDETDNTKQQCSEKPNAAEEQVYDHLNRCQVKKHDHQKQPYMNTYGTVTAVFDDDHYNTLERGSEAEQNQRRSTDKKQTYDHLNRGHGNTNGHQDQLYEKSYSAAADLHDEDLYDTLVHGNKAAINPTSSTDRTKPKETGQEAGNEYQNIRIVNYSKDLENMDGNHYNVLGETVDNQNQKERSAKTYNGKTSSDDYHVLHSGRELGDYHQYQYPEQELYNSLATNSRSTSEDNEDMYYYPVVNDQGNGVDKEPLSQTIQANGDDYYSVVNVQGQVGAGEKHHEPIFSSDVYSEMA